jgi:hypothetical protein
MWWDECIGEHLLVVELDQIGTDVPADVVLVGGVFPDERLIHKRDQGRFRVVVGAKGAAQQKRNAERLEVSRFGFADVGAKEGIPKPRS